MIGKFFPPKIGPDTGEEPAANERRFRSALSDWSSIVVSSISGLVRRQTAVETALYGGGATVPALWGGAWAGSGTVVAGTIVTYSGGVYLAVTDTATTPSGAGPDWVQLA